MGRNADPGRRAGLLPSLALGYLPTPLQGAQDEAAASLPLHFLKNVQSPGSKPKAWTLGVRRHDRALSIATRRRTPNVQTRGTRSTLMST